VRRSRLNHCGGGSFGAALLALLIFVGCQTGPKYNSMRVTDEGEWECVNAEVDRFEFRGDRVEIYYSNGDVESHHIGQESLRFQVEPCGDE